MTENNDESVYIASEEDDDLEVKAALERETADGSGLTAGEEPEPGDYVGDASDE